MLSNCCLFLVSFCFSLCRSFFLIWWWLWRERQMCYVQSSQGTITGWCNTMPVWVHHLYKSFSHFQERSREPCHRFSFKGNFHRWTKMTYMIWSSSFLNEFFWIWGLRTVKIGFDVTQRRFIGRSNPQVCKKCASLLSFIFSVSATILKQMIVFPSLGYWHKHCWTLLPSLRLI